MAGRRRRSLIATLTSGLLAIVGLFLLLVVIPGTRPKLDPWLVEILTVVSLAIIFLAVAYYVDDLP